MSADSHVLEELRVSEEELRAQTEELARAHSNLMLERERYHNLFEHAPVPYIVTDLMGIIRSANRQAGKLLECRLDRLSGKPLAVFVSMRSRSSFRQVLLRARNTGEAASVLLRLAPRTGADCVVTGVVGAAAGPDGDISELRWLLVNGGHKVPMAGIEEADAARARAERTAASMSELLAWASHELRTPAASIGGYADILALGVRGMLTPDQQAILVRIQQSQEHLVSLLEDLVTFARAGAGHLKVEANDVRIEPIIERMLAILEPQAAARDLRLTVAAPPDVVIRGDSERVLQILLNLMTNAVKFTPMGGTVRLTCDPDGDRVLITVSDSGDGIPLEARERVFRPYVQLGRPSGSRAFGAGLGLAISRELSRAMKGELTCEDAREGGSIFVLRLPRSTGVALGAG